MCRRHVSSLLFSIAPLVVVTGGCASRTPPTPPGPTASSTVAASSHAHHVADEAAAPDRPPRDERSDRPASSPAEAEGRDPAAVQRRLEAHLRFLASDALNGRGSGTRDEWIAATYIGTQFAMLGLEPLGDDGWYVQEVEVQRYAPAAPPVLSAGGRTYTRGAQFLVRTVPGPRVGGPLHRHVAGRPVPAGVAVLVPPDTPAAALVDLGRAALLIRKATDQQAGTWSTPARQAGDTIAAQIVGVPETPPSGATSVTLDAATFAAVSALADGTAIELRTELVPGPRTRTWNAVARLAGSDPSAATEAVVVSAHLDHVGARAQKDGEVADVIHNGADDDASGVAAVLELARALTAGPRPRRPIVFALFGSEEAGGFGARYFVDRPVVPLTDIVANLQIEMVGRPDAAVPAGTLWLTGFDRSTLGPQLAARGARLVADPRPDQRFFERSDNIRFARRGVVAHTVSSYGLHKEYHQPSDELRHINLAHMRDAVVSLIEPVRWLASTTDRPTWVEGRRP